MFALSNPKNPLVMLKKPASKFSIVMLIDDSDIDNFINQRMIEGCNFADRIYVHTSSKSALEFLRNIRMVGGTVIKEVMPQLIFLDVNMPIMDGFQFVEEFDKFGGDIKANCKIVMLTSSINPVDVENSKRSSSVIRYVNKPLSKSVLMSFEAPVPAGTESGK